MRSLRRSLMLYFLALIGAGIGAVALFADRAIDRSLRAKEEAAAEAMRLRTEEQVNEARRQFDDSLENQARVLGRVLQVQYTWMYQTETRWLPAIPLLASAGVGAAGPLPGAVMAAAVSQDRRGRPGPLAGIVSREYRKQFQLNNVFLRRADEDDQTSRFVQVNSSGGSIWRTPEMGAAVFDHDPDRLQSDKLIDWAWDDVTLPTGAHGRRIVLRTPLSLTWVSVPRGGPSRGSNFRDPGPPPPRDPGPPPTPPGDFQPLIYISVAAPSAGLDDRVAAIAADADAAREKLARQSERERSRFRLGVVGVGLATFLAIVIGGPILIRRGLAPVDKLSDAVSRVSEKDFHLAIAAEDLSRELVPIHARLTHTLDALRRAFAREKQAVADISHELRTPLAGLLASLEVALRKPRTAEQYKATLEECRQIGKDLSRLVDRILTLASLDAGRTQVHAVAIDVAEVAAGCAAVIRPLAAAHGLTCTADIAPSVEVVTDPDKLRDVLLNLLHNAVEYNRPGGSIRLNVRTDHGDAVFEVADTGIGMPPEVREHIFERFYRADASRHATGVHAGLGLAVVKEYVDRLGGTIDVTSEAGIGSTFRVTLPISASPADDVTREPVLAGE